MSKISWNRQLGLAAGLFALGTTAYWLEFKHKPEKDSSEEQSKRVFQLKDTPVQSVTLVDMGKTVGLVCSDLAAKLCKSGDNSKWEISEPTKLKADDSNANSLISTLNNLTANETIDLKEETAEKKASLIKEYGLDAQSRKTSRRVTVVTPSGETVLYLGLPHPIGESIFAVQERVASGKKATGEADENRVYLIPNYFKANLEHDLTYWRDKKIMTVGAHEVESFQLEGSKAKLSAEKKEGQWILHVGKDEFAGDIENIDNLLSAAAFLTAKAFVSDNKTDAKAMAALKGSTKALTLTIQKEKGTAKEAPAPFTLTLFHKKPVEPTGKLYATVSNLDPLFETEGSSLDRLEKSVKDLRLSKLITSMERFAAKRLEFSNIPDSPGPLLLTHSGGKWLNQPGNGEVATDKVQSTLDKLSGNKIKDFFEGSAIPTGEKDGLKFTLGDEKVETKRQFVFWKKDNKLYARDLQSKRNEAFLIDEAVRDSLPWDKNFFKKSDTKEAAKSDTSKK